MFNKKSVAGRIVIGKLVGLFVGIFCLVMLPTFGFATVSMFGLGTVVMFAMMGVMIGFMGQYDRHPLFDFAMPWYVRGGVVGFIFMLMYVLLSYDSVSVVMQSSVVSWTGLVSPFWTLIDGVVIGMAMGYIETKFAGEGGDLPLK